jgi:hypothetical protein
VALFLVEPGRDVWIYRTGIADLVGRLEPIDVEASEFVVFDSEGRLYCLEPIGLRVHGSATSCVLTPETMLGYLNSVGFRADSVDEWMRANASWVPVDGVIPPRS